MMLKCILKKRNGNWWAGYVCLRKWTNSELCERGKKKLRIPYTRGSSWISRTGFLGWVEVRISSAFPWWGKFLNIWGIFPRMWGCSWISQAWFTDRENFLTIRHFYILLENSWISLAWFLGWGEVLEYVRHVLVMTGISSISQAGLLGWDVRLHTANDKAKQKVRQS